MKKILIIDIETTNFLQKGGKIVEIGIVELNLDNGNIKTLFDEITHESGITLTEVNESWIVKNSTLTTHMIRNSKRLELLRPEIQKILDFYPLGITAYNNSFDFGFMQDRGFRFTRKLQCPMLLSTNVCRIPNTNGYAGFKWPKVQEAYDFLFKENNYIEQHRGCDDAKHEAEIVYELYKRNIFILK
jgi:DNA polymerase-3 subunit epsilon